MQIDLGELVSDIETVDANLAYAITAQPLNGELTGTGPIFTYTPDSGYSGDDAFSFQVTDRGDPDACTPTGRRAPPPSRALSSRSRSPSCR